MKVRVRFSALIHYLYLFVNFEFYAIININSENCSKRRISKEFDLR